MSSPDPKAFVSVLLLESITGLSSSIFIIICLSITGTKGKRISTLNRILMALSASNICYTLTMSAGLLISIVWPRLYEITYVIYIVYYMTQYTLTSTSWLTFTLSFFYLLKIIPSQPGVLAKLKNMTSAIIGWLLLVAEVVSLGGSFLSIPELNQKAIQMNSTDNGDQIFIDIFLALNGLPLFITIGTMVVSASLLIHYNSQMKRNISNINVNVKGYQTAIQTMTALLIFYLLFFLTSTILSAYIINEGTWGYWLCPMFLFSFPTVQSALLIYGNPKLKEALRKLYTFITPAIGSGQ